MSHPAATWGNIRVGQEVEGRKETLGQSLGYDFLGGNGQDRIGKLNNFRIG